MGQETYQKEEWREDEQDTKHSKKLQIKKIMKASKCICKIILGLEKDNKAFGTGFFMYIFKEGKKHECLVTNYHVINENLVNSKSIIEIQINNNIHRIKLDDSNRYIKCFKKPIDITIIQIINSDKFKKDIDFLYYDLNYDFGYKQYLNMDIFSIQHPLGGEAEYACGKIIKIFNNFEFEHTVDTDHGSSGSPIILNESLKVIGIHKQSNTLNNNNIGTFIGEIFKEKDKKEIFQSKEFNDLSPDEFYDKYKNHSQIEELMFLKNIHRELIEKYKFTKHMFDPRGNKIENWSTSEKRGNKIYDPPIGWIGIGLKVLSRYQDDIWIGKSNDQNEWSVAYHGIGSNQSNPMNIVNMIIKGCYRQGSSQIHERCDDIFHPGKKVERGVYCSPNIKLIEDYTGRVSINDKKLKVALMNRVKNSKIRCCNCNNGKLWVVNETTDEIRPYRILLKILN